MGHWAPGGPPLEGAEAPRYLDAIPETCASAGFSIENAVHAFWLLDSYVYGHVIQETSLPISTWDDRVGGIHLEQITMDEYPHLVEIEEHALRSEYSFDNEFEFGLDLILDALERITT